MSNRLKLVQKLDAKEKPMVGRFIGKLVAKVYKPRILRGSIGLPVERVRRAKAQEKRARKAALRS